MYLLNSKLAALTKSSQSVFVIARDATVGIGDSFVKDVQRLTASTLKSDVLPAFCSPIIVTSISVAL
jgi:hypothetical protein